MLLLVLWASFFFTVPLSMRSPRAYEYCSKNLSGCNVFSSTVFRYLKKKHSNEKVFFVHISSVFEARLKLIAASIT